MAASAAPAAHVTAAFVKHAGHWCAGSAAQLHHEKQQRHKGVSLAGCQERCLRVSCVCYQFKQDGECRVSPPGEFERTKRSSQGFDAYVHGSTSPTGKQPQAAGDGMAQALSEFAAREREAWRTMPGCADAPEDPYTDAYLDQLVGRLPRSKPRQWDEVLSAWHGVCASGLMLVSLYKGRIAAAVCDNADIRRAAFGSLVHYRVFKYVLAAALAGLASDGRRPRKSSDSQT